MIRDGERRKYREEERVEKVEAGDCGGWVKGENLKKRVGLWVGGGR